MDEPVTGRTIIGSVVFVDIVAYSKASDARQLAMKTALNSVIADALSGIAERERVVLDTGDGAAICFLGDPEDAMYVANEVSDAAKQLQGEAAQQLRTGINLGPIKLVKDFTGRPNVVGDGINVAQRIMSFADEGEVLVSRSYYEVVACLRDGNQRLFRGLGVIRDKHVREHQVYALTVTGNEPEADVPAPVSEPDVSRDDDTPTGLLRISPEALERATERLSDLIGPVASIVVSRARKSSADTTQLMDALAGAIADPGDRSAFRAEFAQIGHEPAAQRAPEEGVDRQAASSSQPAFEVPAELQAQIERQMVNYLGPLAKVLVRKAAQQARDLDGFVHDVAGQIDDPAARESFLADVRTHSDQ